MSSVITDAYFLDVNLSNRILVALNKLRTKPIVMSQYLSHFNNSSTVGLQGIPPIALKIIGEGFSIE